MAVIHGTGLTTDDVVQQSHNTLPVATSTIAGIVKIGSGVDVTGDGTISIIGGGDGGSGAFPLAEDGYTETYPVVDGTGGGSYGHAVLLHSGANGGALTLKTGDDVDGGGVGAITLRTGTGTTTASGSINLTVGPAADSHQGQSIALTAGYSSGNNGGDVRLHPGQGSGAGNRSGRVLIELTPDNGGADRGLIMILNLPTSDPQVADALWNDAGTLKVSTG
jgi:hypothetical protein